MAQKTSPFPPVFVYAALRSGTGPERLSLAVGNRLGRGRFNVRRYGFPLYASTQAARVLGLRSIHRRLKLRQEDILLKHIK